jgi:hypothetical protein
VTFFAFGQDDPGLYGVLGRSVLVDAGAVHPGLPERLERPGTQYVAVSASLLWGPWGPAGYFDARRGAEPAWVSPDGTVWVFEASAVPG